jgi:serine/threonine protein kinase
MSNDDAKPTRDATTRRNESTIVEIGEEDILATPGLDGERYTVGEVIGVGGMGEVRACRDAHLAREVAMKLVRADRDAPHLEKRFLAEARVQGGLEHPGIVPVYDLGRDGKGRAFFTMKRVRGVELDLILAGLARGDAKIVREYTLHRLLTAFAQVCLTVDFAHTRGVVHRDLKPSNVMFGDYGEVYVLDWGIAKVRPPVVGDETAPVSAPTGGGAVVGTLGYIAPELAMGSRGDARADVFSLGAILFEILTHEALVADDAAAYRFLREPDSVERRPRLRAPDRNVPAELDAIAYRATSPDLQVRFATARDLHDAVEAFLSGDRDLLLRRKLAGEHVARAEEMVTRALAGPIASGEIAAALREAGRAVALSPEDPRALRMLVRLLTEPPAQAPPEVHAQLASLSENRMKQSVPVWAIFVVPVLWVTLYPLVLLLGGVRDWREAVLVPIAWCVAGVALYVNLRVWPHRLLGDWIGVLGVMLAMGVSSVLAGPMTIVPAMTVGFTMAFSVRPRQRALATIFGCAALIVPVALSWSGIVEFYRFEGGAITMRLAQDVTPASFFIGATSLHVVALLVGTRFIARYRRALEVAETRNALFSWKLSKLLPPEVSSGAMGAS